MVRPLIIEGLDFIPHSAKNRQVIVPAGKRCEACGMAMQRRIQKSAEAKADQKAVSQAARIAQIEQRHDGFGDDDLAALVTVHARSGTVDVELYSIGPRPKGMTGRRQDLHNVFDVLFDGLQGLWFENDNQIRRIAAVRPVD